MLNALLAHPFAMVRLSAYWDRIEPSPGHCDTSELDWQLDAAERAGKKIIVCLGPVKSFGYPEYFVPDHQLAAPLPEGSLVTPATHPGLLAAGIAHATRRAGCERRGDRRIPRPGFARLRGTRRRLRILPAESRRPRLQPLAVEPTAQLRTMSASGTARTDRG